MSYDLDQFARDVMHGISAPVTDANLRAFRAWHACEGGQAAYNPLNTTQGAPGATDYNSVHVRNYPDQATGVRATVQTLVNGYYPHVVEGFRRGRDPYDICTGPASHELDVWGTHGSHVKAYLDANGGHHVDPTPAPPPRPTQHRYYVVQGGDTLDGIAHRFHVNGGWQRLYSVNRKTIGPNPNVIHPGQRLVLPG